MTSNGLYPTDSDPQPDLDHHSDRPGPDPTLRPNPAATLAWTLQTAPDQPQLVPDIATYAGPFFNLDPTWIEPPRVPDLHV